MQYRSPVGAGPSSKTWPRWPWHLWQRTSVRGMKKIELSAVSSTAPFGGERGFGWVLRLVLAIDMVCRMAPAATATKQQRLLKITRHPTRPPRPHPHNPPAIGLKKLGHPVPDSYLESDGKSGLPQPAQTKVPLRFSV
jgi:hypothetical protein